jgi:hypothetical protein
MKRRDESIRELGCLILKYTAQRAVPSQLTPRQIAMAMISAAWTLLQLCGNADRAEAIFYELYLEFTRRRPPIQLL